ncbi:MAG: hypothetical protein IJ690_06255 [Clostridia bacterium]|nr:hypothetical protein [Clostridia bacterium]
MFKSKKKVEFDDEELRTILHALNDFRTDLLKEDKLVDPINEVIVKLDNKMKVTKDELAVMINGLDYKRKALLKENQDTPEIDVLLLKIIDISEKI